MSKNLIKLITEDNNIINYNRTNLISGINRQGIIIPKGGIRIKNDQLAGYIQNGGKKKWKIIGKINRNDTNHKFIPYYKDLNVIKKGGNNTESKQISLKSAVKLLREYYRNNFN